MALVVERGRKQALPEHREVELGAGLLGLMESLILAQDKRWRRALRMQVERPSSEGSGGRVSNTYVTYREVGDTRPKGRLIPHVVARGAARVKGPCKRGRLARGVRPIS